MSNYLDLKVGKKLKVYRFKWGTTQNGMWGLFSYTPYEKNQDGSTTYGQEYSIMIANIDKVKFSIKDGDSVEIEKINSITADFQSYTSKTTKQKVNKTVIKVSVDIKTTNESSSVFVPDSEFENQPSAPQNTPVQTSDDIEFPFPVDDDSNFGLPNL